MGSATVFDAFVAKKLANVRHRLRVDVAALRESLHAVARLLWDSGERTVPLAAVKQAVGDDRYALDQSIAHALVDESLLNRDLADRREHTSVRRSMRWADT
jgi:hypothetical protein